MGVVRTITSAILSLVLAGCTESDPVQEPSDGSSAALTLDDLRTATSCPVGIDGSQLPESLELDAVTVAAVTEYGAGVTVACRFPVVGATPAEEVQVMLVAVPPDSDLFAVESASGGTWVNLIYNETGVDPGELEESASGLPVEDVEQLEGNGESLAVRPFEVEDAGSALLLVYGEDNRTGDELAAVASAIR